MKLHAWELFFILKMSNKSKGKIWAFIKKIFISFYTNSNKSLYVVFNYLKEETSRRYYIINLYQNLFTTLLWISKVQQQKRPKLLASRKRRYASAINTLRWRLPVSFEHVVLEILMKELRFFGNGPLRRFWYYDIWIFKNFWLLTDRFVCYALGL